jgi:NAD(P)-dependent dehydrogenase (short-subunit alcohol dehydrogenase family)
MTLLFTSGLMIKTDQVRIINVSSIGHTFFQKFDLDDLKFERTANPKIFEIYCISKLCNILFTNELVKKLEPHGKWRNLYGLFIFYRINQIVFFLYIGKQIVCNAVHPGAVHTEFARFITIPIVRELLDLIARFFIKV